MNTLIAFSDVKMRMPLSEILTLNGHSVRLVAEIADLPCALRQATYGLIIIHRDLLGRGLFIGVSTIKDTQRHAELWIVSGGEFDGPELTTLPLMVPDRTVNSTELWDCLSERGYIKGM